MLSCADLPGHDALAGRVQAVEHRSTDGWEYLRTTIADRPILRATFAPA